MLKFSVHPKVFTIYAVDVISDIDEANALQFLQFGDLRIIFFLLIGGRFQHNLKVIGLVLVS